MRNSIVVVLCMLALLALGAFYLIFLLTVTTVEKINMTGEQYLLETSDSNISLVSEEKLLSEYLYAIRHYRHIDTEKYQLDCPNDIILQSFSGELSYLILSKQLPSPKYIKKWTWKK